MKTLFFKLFISCLITSCTSSDSETEKQTPETDIIENPTATEAPKEETPINTENGVLNLTVSGQPNAYNFSVTVKSPDTGCKQYADWWEVIDTEGNLIYRRILAHSHVNEQPFTRSGGSINVKNDTELIIRAHMNTTGYLAQMLTGSIQKGFTPTTIDSEKFLEAAKQPPLPSSCAF